MLNGVDSVLNSYTMYRVLLYGLVALLLIAMVLGLTGAVSISPSALLVSTGVLLVSCYSTNKALSHVLRVPTNSESWLISALILACILPPVHSLRGVLYTALAGLLAMASKFIIVHDGHHILNPAAFGAFAVSITALLPATWWIATPWLTPFTALVALAVLRKQRRFQLFFVFAAAAVAMLLLTGTVLQGISLISVLQSAALSWPIIYFGSVMLTEPATSPPTRYYQLLLAVIVGVLFTSQLHAGRLATTPEMVLLVGNVLTALAIPAYGFLLKLKESRLLSPGIYEVSFSRPARFMFTAGQYAELTLPHAHADGRGNRRTFSITSGQSDSELRFAFRLSGNGSSFKARLASLTPGGRVRIGPVAGDFTLPKTKTKPLLLIAGGIGITPYHSMIDSLADKRDIVLLYSASDPQSFVYKTDFDQAARLGVQSVYLRERLTPESLLRLVPDIQQRLVYISGPDSMVRSHKNILAKLGIHRSAVKTDYFTGY